MQDIFISLIIFVLYIGVIEPFFHEMGHALELKKYEEHPAIAFYIPFYKGKLSLLGVDIFFVRNKKYKNITYSVSDYQILDEDEVRIVATGGIRNSYILLGILFIISIFGKLCFLFGLSVFMFFVFIHSQFFSKLYSDFKIRRSPREFLERYKNFPKDSEMLYKNLINKYKE
nr:MAG TPA: type IV collagenase [Caudoviricetes sp.]